MLEKTNQGDGLLRQSGHWGEYPRARAESTENCPGDARGWGTSTSHPLNSVPSVPDNKSICFAGTRGSGPVTISSFRHSNGDAFDCCAKDHMQEGR